MYKVVRYFLNFCFTKKSPNGDFLFYLAEMAAGLFIDLVKSA